MEPVFNLAVESILRPDKDWELARYTSTNRLFTSYAECGESRVKFSKRGQLSMCG